MKHDHRAFTGVTRAYQGDAADRIRRFLPMVRKLAWHIHGGGRAGIELEDLVQAGLVALTECAQRHAGPSEDGFAAYAKLRVRGAMVDLVRRAVPLSRSLGEKRRKIAERQGLLRTELGRVPTPEELARSLGVTIAELDDAELPRFESLDAVYSDNSLVYADDRPDSLALIEDAELRQAVASAIGALPERLQLIIQLYFVEEMNLAEIAGVFSVSIPRIHQLKAQALDQLRKSLSAIAEVF